MSMAKEYFTGLRHAYYEVGKKELWDNFEKVIHGTTTKDIEKLTSLYPDTPKSLLELLTIVDGTYWREYFGENIAFYFLGSDVSEYPYYLLSAQEMCESDFDWIASYINREYDEVVIDEKIIDKSDKLCWLHFSDCMNNGGTSQLFIDFSPSSIGTKGQIVRFLHDPDQLVIIANSFDEYLKKVMANGYEFVTKDIDF